MVQRTTPKDFWFYSSFFFILSHGASPFHNPLCLLFFFLLCLCQSRTQGHTKPIQFKGLLETGVVLAWPREHGIAKQELPYRNIDDNGVDGGTRKGGLCGVSHAITISNNRVFMEVLEIH
ncbi:hypothetical protein C1H46_042447 [Malus baccata]|uniref:Uncharacterized protein n=1 Tax=Malus baccata TaxID=106549 RepID=A0A540KCT9_MALBA|nr:hypothetical protein C1H46_042447 [Malus baccata]